MIYLLGGYIWLFVHRPFERYTVLGDLQLERVYMLVMILCWVVWPNKGLIANRLHAALLGFTFVVTSARPSPENAMSVADGAPVT